MEFVKILVAYSLGSTNDAVRSYCTTYVVEQSDFELPTYVCMYVHIINVSLLNACHYL